ncbi:MAG: hypothetical protein WC729_27290 [Sphingomonas sp.]|jgi:hypothetical protein|uniref:hypothetical protein n=1 Tax=Sphingomonas sp. TaxID=28214 RepID=UPI0035613FCD
MWRFEGKTFWHNGDPLSLSHVSANNCAFNQCFTRSVSRGWNRFSDIHLDNVSHWNCEVTGCVFDEVTLRHLKKAGSAPLFLNASVFRHVTLEGNISGLKVNRSELETLVQESDRKWRDEQIVAFYSSVDWALDISKAKFPNGATFEAIPGDKVVRDRTTQALIRREALSATNWRALDYGQTAIDIAISWFETGSLFDAVVVVPRSSSKYRQADIAVIEMLRRQGVAEPD